MLAVSLRLANRRAHYHDGIVDHSPNKAENQREYCPSRSQGVDKFTRNQLPCVLPLILLRPRTIGNIIVKDKWCCEKSWRSPRKLSTNIIADIAAIHGVLLHFEVLEYPLIPHVFLKSYCILNSHKYVLQFYPECIQTKVSMLTKISEQNVGSYFIKASLMTSPVRQQCASVNGQFSDRWRHTFTRAWISFKFSPYLPYSLFILCCAR